MTPDQQLNLLTDYSPPGLQAHFWRGFTRDTDEAEASRLFAARYGAPPEFIIESKGILLAGPIPASAPRNGATQHDEATS